MLDSRTKILHQLPPFAARRAKFALAYPRYYHTLRRAKAAHKTLGGIYSHSVLFVAGLPKSGSTWLERMLASYPGYHETVHPASTYYELKHGQSHLQDLPENYFDAFKNALVVTKSHCHGSLHNATILHRNTQPYVILHRDPRDVAVSYCHYVKNTPWHADYRLHKKLTQRDQITLFLRSRLPEFAKWMRSWRDNRREDSSIMLSYEQLLQDTSFHLRRIATLFKLPADDTELTGIVEKNTFNSLKRQYPGLSSFFRQGQSGAWKLAFDNTHKSQLLSIDSDLLKEFGYEKDSNW